VIITLAVIAAIGGLLVGAGGYGLWLERRHDCLPHDPKRCRPTTVDYTFRFPAQEDTDHDG